MNYLQKKKKLKCTTFNLGGKELSNQLELQKMKNRNKKTTLVERAWNTGIICVSVPFSFSYQKVHDVDSFHWQGAWCMPCVTGTWPHSDAVKALMLKVFELVSKASEVLLISETRWSDLGSVWLWKGSFDVRSLVSFTGCNWALPPCWQCWLEILK